MKKLIYLLYLSVLASIIVSCTPEEINIQALTDFAPGIARIVPADKGMIVKGDFNITVVFVDGTISPLANSSVTLMDENDNEITTASEDLTGTKDSLIIEGSSFNASNLALGNYKLKITGTDDKDQSVEKTTTFTISSLPYPANNNQMFIAGAFNGWGADQMTLVADYTWEIRNVDLKGGEWKFKNTPDWTDQDWGDSNCDGIMEVTTGGGPNTNCGYSGIVNIQFNDQTLRYTVTPAVQYETNLMGLVLLGTFNNFQGDEYKFTLVDDHMWELSEIRLKPGYNFKFAEYPSFQGTNYGDNEPDSIADQYGANIVVPDTKADAFYKIIFNDKTLKYSLIFLRFPYPENLYLVGGSTPSGWDTGASVPFIKTGNGYFEIFSPITVDGSGFKLLQVKDWAGDWGSKPGTRAVDNGVITGDLLQEGEDNMTVEEDGFYRINIDYVNLKYTVTPSNWGLVGSATGSWDVDTQLTKTGDYTWSVTTDLVAGEIKFRENGMWDVNFGDSNADGSLEKGGDNIAVAADGNYTITLNLDPGGYSYSVTKN